VGEPLVTRQSPPASRKFAGALDDDARNPRYIETRHRRGYRLLAALDANSVAKRLDGLRAGVPNLALPDKPSIAVLPFQNFSGDPEQEYFTDGITEDITTELSRSALSL
jgi:hypothetical protein